MCDNMPSKRISVLSFVAMWCVVAWHCYTTGSAYKFVVPFLCNWAVPWFFVISGAFFFLSVKKYSLVKFILNKTRTLLVPYVLWSVIGFALYWAMSDNPQTNIDAIFAFTDFRPIGNFPLWFIRALMIFFAISYPMGKLLLRLTRKESIVRMGLSSWIVVAIMGVKQFGVTIGPGSCSFWFALGICMSPYLLSDQVHSGLRSRMRWIIGGATLAVAFALRIAWFLLGHDSAHIEGGTLLANLSVLFFIMGVYLVMTNERLLLLIHARLTNVLPLSTFVYLVHYTPLTRSLPLWKTILGDGNLLFVLLATLAPLAFVVLGWALRKYCYIVYNILTGGR